MRITDYPLVFEVRDEYVELRRKGSSRDDAVQQLVAEYADELTTGAEDDGLQFWVGLADGQYQRKELQSDVAEKALAALEALAMPEFEITPGDILRRQERYAQAPMPERKVGKPRKKFHCTWSVDDVYAYRMTGEEAEGLGIRGKYMLMQMTREMELWDQRVVPVVVFSVWDDLPLPSSMEELCRAPLLRIMNGRFFTPKDVFEYEAEFIIKNEKQLAETPLIYVGNFPDYYLPEDMLCLRESGNATMMELKTLEADLCLFYRAATVWGYGTAERKQYVTPK